MNADRDEPELPIGESEWTLQRPPHRGNRAGRGRSCLPILLLMLTSVALFGQALIRGVA